MKVTYRFSDDKDLDESFEVDVDDGLPRASAETLPEWTRLECHQCSNCPYQVSEQPHCPAAVALVELLPVCEKVMSHDQLNVTVVTEERTVEQKTSAQRGVSSLMGLLLAMSGCPRTAVFKPMARFHLPFASEEETFYRVTSMYALAQFLTYLEGREPDMAFESLMRTYKEIQLVNRAMANRIRTASTTDSSANAIVILDTFAQAVPFIIEESLDSLKSLFEPFVKLQEA